VLITGASRGIGAQIALQYARAGASLSLVARTQSSLGASKDAILRELPSAQVLTFPADVRDVKRAEEVVAATVAHLAVWTFSLLTLVFSALWINVRCVFPHA
jgi:short-subunit dehydrogenase